LASRIREASGQVPLRQGTHTIVTGISEAVAVTIVDLGIDWSEIEPLRDLRVGLRVALQASPQAMAETGS
jgi:hypothetical protein